MRVTSEFWVSALCRRTALEGAFAYVAKRGAAEAGAIFILSDDMQGGNTLFAPAPQAHFDPDETADRLFEVRDQGDRFAMLEIIEREKKFDPDLWLVEIEDREKRVLWNVVEDE